MFGGAYVGKLGVARRTGALAYLSGSIVSNDLVLVDRSGRQEALPAPADRYFTPRFSPDGSRIAVTILNMVTAIFGSGDLWVYDLRSKNRTRVTFDSVSSSANWAPGGRYLAYSSLHGGRKTDAVYRIAVDGSGTPESLLVRPAPVNEAMFTPDGRRLVFREGVSGRARDIWVVPVDSSAGARPLLRTPFNERMIALSPDGHWLAYVSNEAGTDEVYVRTLEEGSPRWRVSTGGGTEPRWGPGARELFFRHADSVYVTRVEPGTEFRNGRARALFGGRFQTNPNLTTWDVSPDGSRFVFVRTSTGEEAQAVHLLLHWFERRLAVGEKP